MAKGTVAQKIIDAHIVSGEKTRGSRVSIKIDQTLTQDATGTMAYLELEAMGVEKVKTELSVSYVDHNMPQMGPENANDHLYLQSVAAAKGVRFSRPGNGICHQVHLERFGAPGKTLLGSDSHTPTGGGAGMIAIGAGGLDVALAMGGQPFGLNYPEVAGIKLTGKLKPWSSAKDVILKVLQIMTTKGNVGKIAEYFGPGVKTLSVPERATITNMGAELGVTCSVFPSDKNTLEFLKAQGREDVWKEIVPDSGAEYDSVTEINLVEVVPMAACPSSPDNVKSIGEIAGAEVRQVVIGSCTNSSLQDLELVAAMLKGKTVHPNVSLAIAPGSRQVMAALADRGGLADIIGAGARLLETSCGPCIGQGFSPSDDSVSLRTFNRNFAGRTGTKNDKAYLVSPATAAASALTGKITDPRTLGMDFPKARKIKSFPVDDSMIIQPPASGGAAEIIRKPTIGAPPKNTAMPDTLDGVILIKTGDKITTDHIMPAGAHLKHRSNIPVYAKVVFECFNVKGGPTFAERAAQVRDSGKAGVIVGRESYGQGSSREHAALCPMYLGVKLALAVSMERIHSANLINFGILPLFFANPADYGLISEGASLLIENIRSQLRPGAELKASVTGRDGAKHTVTLRHSLTAGDIETVLAGGRLNLTR